MGSRHFRAEVDYPAPPEVVYDALARPGGAAGWWSTDGGTVAGAGEHVRLNWGPEDHVTFRVDVAERPRAMRWTCVDQRDRNLPQPDEWVGTQLVFELEPAGGGTRLRFEHDGLEPRLECYDVCERGWDFFLRRSVRSLVESGSGLPYEAAA